MKYPRPKTVKQKVKEAAMKVGFHAAIIPCYAVAGLVIVSILTLGMIGDQFRKLRSKHA